MLPKFRIKGGWGIDPSGGENMGGEERAPFSTFKGNGPAAGLGATFQIYGR